MTAESKSTDHPTLAQSINEIRRDLHECRNDIKLVRRHVVGESEPDRSLLWRVGALEAQNKRQAWWMKGLGGGFIGALGTWIASKFLGGHL